MSSWSEKGVSRLLLKVLLLGICATRHFSLTVLPVDHGQRELSIFVNLVVQIMHSNSSNARYVDRTMYSRSTSNVFLAVQTMHSNLLAPCVVRPADNSNLDAPPVARTRRINLDAPSAGRAVHIYFPAPPAVRTIHSNLLALCAVRPAHNSNLDALPVARTIPSNSSALYADPIISRMADVYLAPQTNRKDVVKFLVCRAGGALGFSIQPL